MSEFEDWGDDEGGWSPREPPTCNRCGTGDLEWVDIGGGRWRLYEGQRLHKCAKPSAKDVFADVKV